METNITLQFLLKLELPQNITDELKAAFYLEHNIIDNQIWVCEHMNPKDVKMVIMKHPDLIDSELNYDSDNFPLVAAIEVEAKESFLPIAYTSVPGASACGVVVPTSSEEHAAINTAVITSNKIFFIFSELFFGG